MPTSTKTCQSSFWEVNSTHKLITEEAVILVRSSSTITTIYDVVVHLRFCNHGIGLFTSHAAGAVSHGVCEGIG